MRGGDITQRLHVGDEGGSALATRHAGCSLARAFGGIPELIADEGMFFASLLRARGASAKILSRSVDELRPGLFGWVPQD